MGDGALLYIIDFHQERGTYINIANDDDLPEADFLAGIREKWAAIADDTAAILLAVRPETGMYVYTSKAMWERTAREMAKLHPAERAARELACDRAR